MSPPAEPIELDKAIQQHVAYSGVLGAAVPRLIKIDAEDDFPDSVFIEDTAIVIDNKAVITRIGVKTREGEVDATKKALQSIVGLQVYDMRSYPEEKKTNHHFEETERGTCDGGDVLYPVTYYRENITAETNVNEKDIMPPLKKRGGKHLFVGISSRTNMTGAKYLEKVFSDVEVVPVDLLSGFPCHPLHLKTVVTHLDHETLLMPEGSIGDKLCVLMGVEERGYKVIRLPSISACNVLSINGKLVLATACITRKSFEILTEEVMEKRGMGLVLVNGSEFAKCDGALTCRSILIP
jgi:dimethylargininase